LTCNRWVPVRRDIEFHQMAPLFPPLLSTGWFQ